MFETMHSERDKARNISAEFAKACKLPSEVWGGETVPPNERATVQQPLETITPFVCVGKYAEKVIDEEIYPRLIHLRARRLQTEFKTRFCELFPKSERDKIHLVFGPVKEIARIADKIAQEDVKLEFPRARTSKDALRLYVVCANGDEFVRAYERIKESFALTTRGRLKNKLDETTLQPPSMLLNIYHEPLDCENKLCLGMLAEVQIHLESIKSLASVSH